MNADEPTNANAASEPFADHMFMDQAIAEARAAWREGDVPVGAVVVREGKIIGRGHNRRQVLGDPTAHAEIEALRAASRVVGNWRVAGTLYVTQEPCPMCAGALVNARIERLVYGCPNPKAGAVHTLYEIVTDLRLNHRMEVVAGVRAQECGDLLRGFVAELRSTRNAPNDDSHADHAARGDADGDDSQAVGPPVATGEPVPPTPGRPSSKNPLF